MELVQITHNWFLNPEKIVLISHSEMVIVIDYEYGSGIVTKNINVADFTNQGRVWYNSVTGKWLPTKY